MIELFHNPNLTADQVLAALDPPTRQRLTGLINNLRQTLNGHEQDLNSTVQSAGPALRALGQVFAVTDTFDAHGARTRIDDQLLRDAAERMGALALDALGAGAGPRGRG